MSRPEPIVDFGLRPPPGPLRSVLDILHTLFGKVVSLATVALLLDTVGHIVTNAASGAGTAITRTRTTIDFQDAGIDSARLLVRGVNSAAGSVVVEVFNVTTSLRIVAATLTDATEVTADSGWVTFVVAGGDEEIEVRVIGDGVFDPILYAVHLQLRTTQARS